MVRRIKAMLVLVGAVSSLLSAFAIETATGSSARAGDAGVVARAGSSRGAEAPLPEELAVRVFRQGERDFTNREKMLAEDAAVRVFRQRERDLTNGPRT